MARWRRAIADGLAAEQAAQAVGVPRSTLYRWERRPEPGCRRPKRARRPNWRPALVEAVEAIRAGNPMWGKRKIATLLKREGQAASISKVGRILKRLMERGVVVAVPILRRKPGGRRFRCAMRQRYALAFRPLASRLARKSLLVRSASATKRLRGAIASSSKRSS